MKLQSHRIDSDYFGLTEVHLLINIRITHSSYMYSTTCGQLTGQYLNKTTHYSTTCGPWAALASSSIYCLLNAAGYNVKSQRMTGRTTEYIILYQCYAKACRIPYYLFCVVVIAFQTVPLQSMMHELGKCLILANVLSGGP